MLSWLKSDVFFNHSIHIFCLFFHFLVVLLSETQTAMITQHSAADVFPWPQQWSASCSNLLHKCVDSTGSAFSAVLGKFLVSHPTPTPSPFYFHLSAHCTNCFWTGFVVSEIRYCGWFLREKKKPGVNCCPRHVLAFLVPGANPACRFTLLQHPLLLCTLLDQSYGSL